MAGAPHVTCYMGTKSFWNQRTSVQEPLVSKQVPGPSACGSPDHPDYKDSPWHTVPSNLGSLWGVSLP